MWFWRSIKNTLDEKETIEKVQDIVGDKHSLMEVIKISQ